MTINITRLSLVFCSSNTPGWVSIWKKKGLVLRTPIINISSAVLSYGRIWRKLIVKNTVISRYWQKHLITGDVENKQWKTADPKSRFLRFIQKISRSRNRFFAINSILTPEHPSEPLSSSSSSSSSRRAASTDILDHLSPLFPIVHHLRQVFWVTSCVLT